MIRELSEYVDERVRLAGDMVKRATPGPMLVRLAVWGAGVLALALAFPAKLTPDPRALAILAGLALLPTVAPRSRMVSFLIFTAIFGWVVSTLGYEEPITWLRLIGLAAALYLLHTGAALAAVLPYDTVVAPGVLVGWLLRTIGVVAVSAVLGVVVLKLTDWIGIGTSLVASLAGLAAAALLVWLIARVSKRGA